MSCGFESLFTKFTLEPTGIVTDFGDTPLAVIVIVAAIGPGVVLLPPPDPLSLGDVEDPPHAATSAASATTAARPTSCMRAIRRTSSRC
jgi:hypothetical protein